MIIASHLSCMSAGLQLFHGAPAHKIYVYQFHLQHVVESVMMCILELNVSCDNLLALVYW